MTRVTWRVRAATPEDREFLVGLTPRLASGFPLPMHRASAEIAGAEAQALRVALESPPPGSAILVAEDSQHRPAGFAFLLTETDYFTQQPHAHLSILAVDEAREGQGVGRTLLDASEAWARQRACPMLTLNVFAANVRARAVYEKAGFTPETVRYVKPLPRQGRLVKETCWRRLDEPGSETARLIQGEDEWILEGRVNVGVDGARGYIDYRVECSGDWLTRRVSLTGRLDARAVAHRLEADAARDWRFDGRRAPEVSGCEDVDLSFSPVTNLLPIRRLALATGQAAVVRSAWVLLPDFRLERLEQEYRRLSGSRVAYSAPGTGYRAELEVDEVGLVVRYPGLWEAEPRGPA